jgi:REP element-mobilizing transposase RayT
MPRPLRIDLEGGWHHVMNRGIDHADVFLADSDRVEFGQRLADVFDRFGVRTHAYCLMDNHFHLLWQCPDGGLSASMQRLSSLYTRHVNDRLGRDGPIFRGRFHSRLITDERHLVATARYIHRNPLELPGVVNARDYRWSSHRTYLGLRRKPAWLFTSTVLAGWEPEAFDRFVDDDSPSTGRPDADLLRAMVTAAELVLAERGSPADARLGAVARRVVLAWAIATSAASDDVFMDCFALSASALQKAASRARATVAADAELGVVMSKVIDLVASQRDNTGLTRVVYSAARAAS